MTTTTKTTAPATTTLTTTTTKWRQSNRVWCTQPYLFYRSIFASWCQAVSEKIPSFWQHLSLLMKMFKNNFGQTERLNDRWTGRWADWQTDRQTDTISCRYAESCVNGSIYGHTLLFLAVFGDFSKMSVDMHTDRWSYGKTTQSVLTMFFIYYHLQSLYLCYSFSFFDARFESCHWCWN